METGKVLGKNVSNFVTPQVDRSPQRYALGVLKVH